MQDQSTEPLPYWQLVTNTTPKPEPKRTHKLRWTLAGVGALLLTAGAGIGISQSTGGSGATMASANASSDNYHDVATLEQNVKASYQAAIDKDGTGGSVTDVTCIQDSHDRNLFTCLLTDSYGDTASHQVVVNAAGDNWVTKS